MFNDSFKKRYTTIPFAYYSAFYGENDESLVGNKISHNHQETEMIIVTEGKVKISINNARTYEAKKGDVIIISPYEYHCLSKYSTHPFGHACICFDTALLYDKGLVSGLESGEYTISTLIPASLPYTAEIFENIQKSIGLCRESTPGWELCTVGCLSTVVGLLKRYGHINLADDGYSNEFSKSIITILNSEYKSDLTSAHLAKQLSVTPSYFCRKFKSSFGYTFSEYLCMYRIEKSKELLRNTDKPVSSVASEVGFSSFSYYSKMFKSYMKISPSMYREKITHT